MENNKIKKVFWKDKKNIAIIILSTLLLFSFIALGENDNTSNETNTLNSKLSNLEASISTLEKENQNLENENTKLKQEKENLEIENQSLKETSNQSQQTVVDTTPEKENTTQSSEDKSETVWVGESGNKYHTQNCRTLKGKGHEITLQQALAEGRQACKVCH